MAGRNALCPADYWNQKPSSISCDQLYGRGLFRIGCSEVASLTFKR
jgi:hypothetical protein